MKKFGDGPEIKRNRFLPDKIDLLFGFSKIIFLLQNKKHTNIYG